MEFIITFFRDILDGPLYIVVAVISVILICSCIGYLAETSLNKKKAKQQYDESHANIGGTQEIVAPAPPNVNQTNTVEVSNTVNVQTGINQNNITSSTQMQQSYSAQAVGNPAINTVQQPIPELNSQPNTGIPQTMGTPVQSPAVQITPQQMPAQQEVTNQTKI